MSSSTPFRLPGTAGLAVTRRFAQAGDPFAGITFVKRDSVIRNPDGSVVHELRDFEVPDFFGQVETDIIASRYARKAGVPQLDDSGEPLLDDDGAPVTGAEMSMRQIALRLANAWRHWGVDGGYFASEADADAYRDDMAYMIIHQMGAPNSPQWFNTGLFEAYGIVEEPEGNSYWDPESGEVVFSAHKYERSAANACFISSLEDTLVGERSIFRHMEREARLFKSGSGSGANYSMIREEGAPLTAGGKSSGLMSFLRVMDRAAGAIKSGGTTRRAAKMVIVDLDHPDIEDFIWCKVLEERKVAALVAAGYDSDFNGEAYDTVAFQNANHSVRVPAGFLDAVAADDDWELTSRRDGAVVRKVKARDLWEQVAEAAWQSADPGVQFDDILNDWNTAADSERLRGTNPCSEYTHVDDTACNLASLNLVKFLAEDGSFDVEAFRHAVRLWAITLEITVAMSHYPDPDVAQKSYEHRTLGLGYANLGAMLMRSGLAYDSDGARAVMGAVTAIMHNDTYAASAEMAAAVGPCIAFESNTGSALRVLRNHRRAAYGSLAARHGIGDYEDLSVRPVEIDHLVLAHTPFADLSESVLDAADRAVEMAGEAGLRNMQATVLAPTGTIGLAMACDTTGVEPDFALVKVKKLAGGGYMRIVNASVEPALRRLGYGDDAIAEIFTWLLGTQTLSGPHGVNRETLLAAGMESGELDAVEAQLSSQSDLTWAFASYIVGDGAYSRMGLDPAADDGAALLRALGFSGADIGASSKAILGHLTVEGCPALRDEHLSVFDCAVECGDGTRSIAWSGHVKALAAVAPHISGSVSKTVNMPQSASVDDVEAAYRMGHELGVKCVAIYRDGSKLSQPLNSAKSSDDAESGGDVIIRSEEIPAGMSPSAFYQGKNPPRFKLPNLRYGPTWRFEVGGEEVYLHAGEYPDGTIGEVFVDWGKQGSTLRGITSALSISISQGLQHGVPLAKLVDSLRGHSFEPRGVVSGHENLKMAASLTDAIMRVLGHHYLGRTDLVQVPGGAAASAQSHAKDGPAAVAPAAHVDVEEAVDASHGTTATKLVGKTCSSCGGSNMIQAGSCAVCGDCGTTTGCS